MLPRALLLFSLITCPLLSVNADNQEVLANRIAVFSEPHFPSYMSDARITPARVADWLGGCGLEADLLKASELADANRFNAQRYDLLVYVYGNTWPQMARDNLRAFHEAGGCLLLVGGTPFCHPCVPEGATDWSFGETPRQQPLRDEQVIHTGKASLRLGPSTGDWYGPETLRLAVEAGKLYSLGAWMRTSADFVPDERARFYLRAWDKDGNFLGQSGPAAPSPGSDWTWVEASFEPPAGVTTLDASLQMWCKQGTLWIDDVVLSTGPKCDPAANLIANPGFEELPEAPTWTDLGHRDDFGHDAAGLGTGGFLWVEVVDAQECLPAGLEASLEVIPWADRMMPSSYCLLDPKSLPAEDKAIGLVAALHGGELLGWPVAAIQHGCLQFAGAIDVLCGANMLGVLKREEQHHLVVRSVLWVLEKSGRLRSEVVEACLAELEETSPSADLTRIPKPVEEPKPFLGLFPRTPAPARELIIQDLRGKSRAEQFLATVLQGLVNRREPRLYAQVPVAHGSPSATSFWLDNLKERGYTTRPASDTKTLIEEFNDCWQGAALYPADFWIDPERRPFINILMALCAVRDLLPVTPLQNEQLGLPVVFDATEAWSSVREATLWALRELWPQCNHHVLAYHHPDHIPLCDYLVAFRIFPIATDSTMPEATDDLLEQLLRDTPPNIPVMGCWGQYGEKPPLGYGEGELVNLTSEWGKVFVVSEWAANLSVHSGVPVKPEELRQRPDPPMDLDLGKVYVCLDISDGDNLQYVYNNFFGPQWWGNSQRGQVNLGWSIGPGAVDLMPDVMAYYYRTATPADGFLCAVSGAGYCYPDTYASRFGEQGEALFDGFLDLTREMMQRSDTQVLNPFRGTRARYERYAERIPELDGILADYGKGPQLAYAEANYTVDGNRVPVFRVLVCQGGQGDVVAETVKELRQATPDGIRPAFLHVFAINWWNNPTGLAQVMEQLGEGYVACTPGQFVDLWRQAQAR